jgi:hypothetical protein
MRRSVLQAGAWTALGLAAAFAVVSANSSHRRAVTTAAEATVAAAPAEKCTSTDACCARKASVAPASFAAVKHPTKTKGARPVGVSGLVVAVDPATGDLGMPSPEQMAALEAMQSTIPSEDVTDHSGNLTAVRSANGSLTVDLQGKFQEFATVHVGPNGKLNFGCADAPTLPTLQPAPSALEEM